MGDIRKVLTSLGPVKPWVRAAAAEIVAACPFQIFYQWGAPGRGTGDHAQGLALDLMNYDRGTGVTNPGPERRTVQTWVKNYALQHHARLGMTYIIADRRIASEASSPDWTWRTYTGTDPHTNHTHMSFKEVHTYRPPAGEDDWLMGAREDILAAIAGLKTEVTEIQEKLATVPEDVWNHHLQKSGPWDLEARTIVTGLSQTKDAEKMRDKEADADRARIEAAVTDGEETP